MSGTPSTSAATLQDAFDSAIAGILTPKRLRAEATIYGIRRAGIRLSKTQAQKVRELVEAAPDRPGKLDLAVLGIEHEDGPTVSITARDMRARLRQIEKGIVSATTVIIEKAARALLKSRLKTWLIDHAADEYVTDTFRTRLRRAWHRPLNRLALLLSLGRETGSEVLRAIQEAPDPKNAHLSKVLVELHKRSCQVADEILALLSAGFADGAMARWRTLHEIGVVANYIGQRGDEVARAYLEHEVVEAHRAAEQYKLKRRRLGLSPIPRKELAAIRTGYASALARHGKEFGRPYGWAAKALGIPDPKLDQIETHVRLDHLRPYYRMASYNVHATVKGVTSRLGNTGPFAIAGASNYGLADPGQLAALSLSHVTSVFMLLKPTVDSLAAVRAMGILASEVAAAFADAQHRIERREAALRSDKKRRTRKR